jgi:hypothetical protein
MSQRYLLPHFINLVESSSCRELIAIEAVILHLIARQARLTAVIIVAAFTLDHILQIRLIALRIWQHDAGVKCQAPDIVLCCFEGLHAAAAAEIFVLLVPRKL